MLSNHRHTMLLVQSIHGRARRSWPAAKYAGLALSACMACMGAWGAPIPQASQAPLAPELQPYANARSVINQPQAELIRQYRELEDVEFAQSQEKLPFLLEKVGEAVEAFFRDFVNVTSIESIGQEVEEPRASRRPLGSFGQEMEVPRVSLQALHRKCNYLILARRYEKSITLEEYRTNNKGEQIDLSSSYLLTSGFASTPIFLHPLYQSGSIFRYIGRETRGSRLHIIAFAQRPEKAEVIGHFHLAAQPAVILSQGMAWIDAGSYQIVRMRTDLLASRHDILLERQTSEIELTEVRFDRAPRPFWLPRKVDVTVEWQHMVYRTKHRYSDYKLFSVETREDKKEIVRPERQPP